MKVSILSFNHPNLTAKCVDQAKNFVHSHDLILVHNGSRPENVEKLKSLYPEIDHLVIDENRGFTAGVNHLLQYTFSKDPWCLVLTNDCLLISKPKQPNKTGLIAPLIYRRKEGVVDSIGGLFHPIRKKLSHIRSVDEANRWLQKTNRKQTNSFLSNRIRAVTGYFYVPGTAFYIDRATFEKVGQFDETLHTYWEDVDFSVRAQKQSVQIQICTDTKIIHKIGKTCHKDPYYTNYLFQRNRRTISKKYGLMI